MQKSGSQSNLSREGKEFSIFSIRSLLKILTFISTYVYIENDLIWYPSKVVTAPCLLSFFPNVCSFSEFNFCEMAVTDLNSSSLLYK